MNSKTQNPFKRLHTNISGSFKFIAVGCLMLMIFATLAQVIMRTFFSIPMVGVEELARYLLICVVFISLPFAVRDEGHIKMDELQNAFPIHIRRITRKTIILSAAVSFGLVAVAAIITSFKNLDNKTPTLGIPFVVFFLPTILGFSLMVIEYILSFIHTNKKKEYRGRLKKAKSSQRDQYPEGPSN